MLVDPSILSRSFPMVEHVVDLLARPLPAQLDADPETLRAAASVLADGLAAIEPLIDALRGELYRADGGDPLERIAALAREFDLLAEPPGLPQR